MALRFLDFDFTEDAHGTAAWDALASPSPEHNADMLVEVAQLLAQLHTEHGPPGPIDEGHPWDCDLHIQCDAGLERAWRWQGGQFIWGFDCPNNARLTLSLSLSGDAAFTHTLESTIVSA
jgi:hypothetical protein